MTKNININHIISEGTKILNTENILDLEKTKKIKLSKELNEHLLNLEKINIKKKKVLKKNSHNPLQNNKYINNFPFLKENEQKIERRQSYTFFKSPMKVISESDSTKSFKLNSPNISIVKIKDILEIKASTIKKELIIPSINIKNNEEKELLPEIKKVRIKDNEDIKNNKDIKQISKISSIKYDFNSIPNSKNSSRKELVPNEIIHENKVKISNIIIDCKKTKENYKENFNKESNMVKNETSSQVSPLKSILKKNDNKNFNKKKVIIDEYILPSCIRIKRDSSVEDINVLINLYNFK